MKKTELRIGNYIKTDGIFDNKYGKVTQINHDYIQVKIDELTHHYVGYTAIQPIEITEDIMYSVKCDDRVSHHDKTIHTIVNECNSITVECNESDGKLNNILAELGIGPIFLDIHYLHELQNWYFLLTGNELDIKL